MENISEQVFELCRKHLGEFRIRNGEIIAKYCPFCGGGDNGDQETFAVGIYNGAYNCMRGSCNKTGNFRQLCEFFGEHTLTGLPTSVFLPSGKKEKVYDRPNEDMLYPRTEEIDKYFALRKISPETLDAFHISADANGNIVFPFYRDEHLVFVKYREPRKYVRQSKKPKEWMMANTEQILFNMDNCTFNKPLFITEGQIDAMSLYEAGIYNVVSVPAGVNNMDFVTNCWDWLEKFQQIVLFGDSDQPGIEMVSTLMKRLGEDRCLIAPEYPELVINGEDIGRVCKDANEILFAYGPETLKELAESCEPAPVKGVLNLADVTYIDPLTQPRIYTRIHDLDSMIGGLGEGGITIFSGKRGDGKSTVTGSLLLNAIEQNERVCAYSGELSASKFLEWIMLQATESKYITYSTDPRNGKCYATVPYAIQERIKEWVDGKFYLYDNQYNIEDTPDQAVLKVFTLCARRYGCKLFLCDNLMTVINASDEEVKAQARFVAALKRFAVKFKAHVILVAHPRKTKAGENLTNDDISGSAAISNLADNVIVVEKPNLRVIKNRDFGVTGLIECSFSPANRRIYQTNVGDRMVYSWDHHDIEIPENQAIKLREFQTRNTAPTSAF